MKKLGRKLCNFTKIFLVFGLLFSNLSSLSIVFAYDGEDETNKENVVEIDNTGEESSNEKSDEELNEENESSESAGENDSEKESEEKTDNSETLQEENSGSEESGKKTDGESDSESELDEEKKDETTEKTEETNTEENNTEGENEVENTEGATEEKDTELENTKTDTTEETTSDNKEETTEENTSGSEETQEENKDDQTESNTEGTTDDEMTEPTEEEVAMADALNASAESLQLDEKYYFISEGYLLYREGVDETEIAQIVENAANGSESSYELDDTALTVCIGQSKVVYELTEAAEILLFGDVDLDGDRDEDDLDLLIKIAIGEEEDNEKETADVNGDGVVDTKDVMLLKNILETSDWDTFDAIEEEVKIDSSFIDSGEDINTDDEFKLQFVVTLKEYSINGIAGLISYDSSMLELISAEAVNLETGEMYEGKFLYTGDSLELTTETTKDEDGNEIVSYEDTDYVMIILTFKALQSGSVTVSADNLEYFDGMLYYTGSEGASIDINIGASGDNSLSSLSVAGNNIALQPGVYQYTLTVSNDVTATNLAYALSSVAANVSSIVAPEQLEVGENTITIKVVAENGEEATYTIVVTRQAAASTAEETTPVVAPVSYTENTTTNNSVVDNTDDGNDKEIIKTDTEDDDEDEDKKEESGSKLSRIIIIILILLVIAGLIYLIFKDDDEDEAETKRANKEVDKLKKEDIGETNKRDNKNIKKGR